MKSSITLTSAATGILGLAIGCIIAARSARETPASEGSTSKGSQTTASINPSEGSHPDRPKRSESSTAPTVARHSLPLSVISEQLVNDPIGKVDFKGMETCVEKTASLLGANAKQKQELKKLFQEVNAELASAEKTSLRLSSADAGKFEIDMSGMKSHVDAAIAKSKEGIAAILPDSRGELLTNSISWENAYPLSKVMIEAHNARNGDIVLMERAGDRLGTTVMPNIFPGETTLPAERLPIDPRWHHLLQGKTITPTPAKN